MLDMFSVKKWALLSTPLPLYQFYGDARKATDAHMLMLKRYYSQHLRTLSQSP